MRYLHRVYEPELGFSNNGSGRGSLRNYDLALIGRYVTLGSLFLPRELEEFHS